MEEIDKDQIQTIFELDPSGQLCEKLLTIFAKEVPLLLYELKRAVHDKNNSECARIVHSIKSSSLNMGALLLAKKSEIYEKNFLENKKQSEDVVIVLTNCFEYIIPILREYFLSVQKKR